MAENPSPGRPTKGINNASASSSLERDDSIVYADALSNCLLSQYRFCAGGVGLGAAYSMKYSKGVLPMVVAGVAGTVADFAYGYTVECAKEVERYHQRHRKGGTGREGEKET